MSPSVHEDETDSIRHSIDEFTRLEAQFYELFFGGCAGLGCQHQREQK